MILGGGMPWRTGLVVKHMLPTIITVEITIWTPAAGKRIRLTGFAISTDNSQLVDFIDGVGGPTILTYPVLALSEGVPFWLPGGLPLAAADNVLRAKTNSGGVSNLFGSVWGYEE